MMSLTDPNRTLEVINFEFFLFGPITDGEVRQIEVQQLDLNIFICELRLKAVLYLHVFTFYTILAFVCKDCDCPSGADQDGWRSRSFAPSSP